jgi:hypothetical protein
MYYSKHLCTSEAHPRILPAIDTQIFVLIIVSAVGSHPETQYDISIGPEYSTLCRMISNTPSINWRLPPVCGMTDRRPAAPILECHSPTQTTCRKRPSRLSSELHTKSESKEGITMLKHSISRLCGSIHTGARCMLQAPRTTGDNLEWLWTLVSRRDTIVEAQPKACIRLFRQNSPQL